MHMNKEVVMVKLSDIIPNRFQPRLTFDEEALNELANSIKEHGIIQPLILRSLGNKFEIIAGERRYKASTLAGLTEVPAIIAAMDDQTSAELALIENIQRKDLSAIEEAKSYKKILEMGDLTQEELAKRMGKNQSTIANKMRLLTLTNEVQVALMNNLISERHARCLLQVKDEDKQKEILNKIISERMTVKDTDDYIKKELGITNVQPPVEPPVEPINENSIAVPKETTQVVDIPKPEPKVEPEMMSPNVYSQTNNVDFINIDALDGNISAESAPEPISNNMTSALNNLNIIPEVSQNFTDVEPVVQESIPKFENKFIPNINNNFQSGIGEESTKQPEIQNISIEPISSMNDIKEENIVPNKLRFVTAIRLAKDTVEDIKTAGYKVEMEEINNGTEYQIIIKIQK